MELFNPAVSCLEPSVTLAINEHCNALIESGKTIYKLGLGQSPFPVPPQVVQRLQEHAAEKDYLPVQGLPALREAVAGHFNRTQGMTVDASQVVIGPGSKELMYILQVVLQCELILPNPYWVSYRPQAMIAGRPVCEIEAHGDVDSDLKLDSGKLHDYCLTTPVRPWLLLLNYPNNPSGTTYTATELEEIADVARLHNIIILSDEIYGEIHHEGEHVSIAKYYPEGTIVSGGLSKWCGAGGWRLGTFIIPKALRNLTEMICAVASETFSSVSAPIQHAAIAAYEGSPEIDEYLRKSRRLLKGLGGWAAKVLTDAGATLPTPKGGFYLMPDFSDLREKFQARDIMDGAEMSIRALQETGVAFLPGSYFGRPLTEYSARLAYVDFDGENALANMPTDDVDEAFLRTYCGNVITGIERFAQWCSQ